MFGGYGYGSGGGAGFLGDLWKFDPITGHWTWVTGGQGTINNTQPVPPSGGEFPAPRSTASSWRDGTGNLWLFGGRNGTQAGGYYLYNDLWSFNPANNNWTLIKGTELTGQAPVYGSQLVPAQANLPGSRHRAAGWSDASGAFWVFGGYGRGGSNNPFGYLSDLWRYRPQDNTWTWMGGPASTDTFEFVPQGASVPTWPGGRMSPATAAGPDGRLWMYGGWGLAAARVGPGSLGNSNELWVLDTSTITMSRVAGSSTLNESGVFGVQGTPSPFAKPSGRWGAVMRFDAQLGYLWLFGGNDDPAGGIVNTYYRNDLWRFLQPGQAAASGAPRGAPTKR